ncbi:hypothetical protein [Carnobacterium inhibens]|uniref:hypothetical protein n=1 Tax=Carnobacterium inhibens TaxID=147709 RepID=UPI002041E44B|nr:hypothetical protein [Carnobacterium inhibens]
MQIVRFYVAGDGKYRFLTKKCDMKACSQVQGWDYQMKVDTRKLENKAFFKACLARETVWIVPLWKKISILKQENYYETVYRSFNEAKTVYRLLQY